MGLINSPNITTRIKTQKKSVKEERRQCLGMQGQKSFRLFFTPDNINRLFMLFCCCFLRGGEYYELVNTRKVTIKYQFKIFLKKIDLADANN
jgi:hypothetical protein